MKPVIPKVKVGDVLRGTRNLRNWLRTASLIYYLEHVEEGYISAKESKGRYLYTPTKREDFVVAANGAECFCVWSRQSKLVLMFLQPGANAMGRGKTLDPTLFAHWFVKTDQRHLNLKDWPDYAYYYWCAVEMGASHLSTGRVIIPGMWNFRTPFTLSASTHYCSRDEAEVYAQHAIKYGLTRPTRKRRSLVGPHFGGAGPLLEDIPQLYERLAELTGNPRVLQAALKDEKVNQGLLKNMLEAIKKSAKKVFQ